MGNMDKTKILIWLATLIFHQGFGQNIILFGDCKSNSTELVDGFYWGYFSNGSDYEKIRIQYISHSNDTIDDQINPKKPIYPIINRYGWHQLLNIFRSRRNIQRLNIRKTVTNFHAGKKLKFSKNYNFDHFKEHFDVDYAILIYEYKIENETGTLIFCSDKF